MKLLASVVVVCAVSPAFVAASPPVAPAPVPAGISTFDIDFVQGVEIDDLDGTNCATPGATAKEATCTSNAKTVCRIDVTTGPPATCKRYTSVPTGTDSCAGQKIAEKIGAGGSESIRITWGTRGACN